ncbi:hypothetical protein B0H16DRAFT_1792256 [Mycena metata]|uniref:Uncharacterized protein n=1 Tax=Mycena metata TaxID=1033252 RepID=A0AAD7HHW0_9AGAR|nr:hypothetical protein B0H16DRAFT_1792256 [Mycena metata]
MSFDFRGGVLASGWGKKLNLVTEAEDPFRLIKIFYATSVEEEISIMSVLAGYTQLELELRAKINPASRDGLQFLSEGAPRDVHSAPTNRWRGKGKPRWWRTKYLEGDNYNNIWDSERVTLSTIEGEHGAGFNFSVASLCPTNSERILGVNAVVCVDSEALCSECGARIDCNFEHRRDAARGSILVWALGSRYGRVAYRRRSGYCTWPHTTPLCGQQPSGCDCARGGLNAVVCVYAGLGGPTFGVWRIDTVSDFLQTSNNKILP